MIRIMSFNIRCGNCDDGDNAWNQRKDRVLARIRTVSCTGFWGLASRRTGR